jgi:transcriptional regulator with XRE-family HTH domain
VINIKSLRIERGLNQQTVADYLGITQQAYANYERGSRQPDPDTLMRLADFFGVSVDELLGRVPTTDTSSPLDAELEGIDFALYGEVKELTDDEKEDVLKFIQFTKSKRTDANDD